MSDGIMAINSQRTLTSPSKAATPTSHSPNTFNTFNLNNHPDIKRNRKVRDFLLLLAPRALLRRYCFRIHKFFYSHRSHNMPQIFQQGNKENPHPEASKIDHNMIDQVSRVQGHSFLPWPLLPPNGKILMYGQGLGSFVQP